MTLPVAPAADGYGRRRWSGWHVLAAALLLCASVLAAPGQAYAADDDTFSATVKVDAIADSPSKAREAARVDGQRRALTALAERMSGGNPVKLPKLDDNAITNLVANFEVANERMSAVRYLGEYTFHFRPDATQRVLKAAGINPSDQNAQTAPGGAPGTTPSPAPAPTKPIIVLPVYQPDGRSVLWDDPNPWREAWAQRSSGSGTSRLTVPIGDVADVAAIDGDKARAADSAALTAIARRAGADEAIVALAAVRGAADNPAGLDVTVRRYRQGKLVDTHFAPVDANPGEDPDAFMKRAAGAIAGNIEGGWKKEATGQFDQQGSLTAIAPISSLDDWLRLRDRLLSARAIRKVDLMSLSRQEATIEIQYLGSIDQLKASLAGINLDLVRAEPNWRLARSGSSPAPK
jgi:hypothetical protein